VKSNYLATDVRRTAFPAQSATFNGTATAAVKSTHRSAQFARRPRPRCSDAAWCDERQRYLVLVIRLVLDPFSNDEHFAHGKMNNTIAEIYPQIAVDHDERLVRVAVFVPDDVVLEFSDRTSRQRCP
jgi:hypothetical protein